MLTTHMLDLGGLSVVMPIRLLVTMAMGVWGVMRIALSCIVLPVFGERHPIAAKNDRGRDSQNV
jgi:hypothetical protein